MLLAEGGDFSSSIEGVYFDLVDGWVHSRFRCEQFFKLERVYQRWIKADSSRIVEETTSEEK